MRYVFTAEAHVWNLRTLTDEIRPRGEGFEALVLITKATAEWQIVLANGDHALFVMAPGSFAPAALGNNTCPRCGSAGAYVGVVPAACECPNPKCPCYRRV